MKKKFILEFDEQPSLIFVQNNPKPSDFDVYQDGEKVKGIRRVNISAGIEEFTTHEIEYATGFTDNDTD
jgi:hypothetical protein